MILASLGDHFALGPAWPLLLIVPLAWLGAGRLDRHRRRRGRELLGARARQLVAGSDTHPSRRHLLLAAGLTCAVLAALQPMWGTAEQRVEQRGIDLVLCVDVSRSMLARDVMPSRLAAARRHIEMLAERARGDRLALVVFAGEARLLVPLTQDVDSFLDLLQQASPTSVGKGGTDLGAALTCALEALRAATGDHEVILLLTDGEDHQGRGERVAKLAKERGIVVHTVGIGSPRGSKIVVDGEGGEAFLRDKAGGEVVSAMDPSSLDRIATAGGGEFVDASSTSRPLVELYDRRAVPMARKALATQQSRVLRNRYQWPLLLGLGLWLWDFARRARVRPRRATGSVP